MTKVSDDLKHTIWEYTTRFGVRLMCRDKDVLLRAVSRHELSVANLFNDAFKDNNSVNDGE